MKKPVEPQESGEQLRSRLENWKKRKAETENTEDQSELQLQNSEAEKIEERASEFRSAEMRWSETAGLAERPNAGELPRS